MINVNSKVLAALEVAKSEVETEHEADSFMGMVDAVEYIYDNAKAHPELPAWEKLAEQVAAHGSDDLVFWIDENL